MEKRVLATMLMVILLGSVFITITSFTKEKPEGAVKRMIKDAGNKKLYYAFKPSKLGKKWGSLSVPFANAKVSEAGVFSFAADEVEVKAFKAKPQVKGEEWVVSEEKIYSKNFSCSRFPDPGPTPPTEPIPPGEWPTWSDRVDWGVTLTRAHEALKHFRGSSVTVCVVDTGVDYNHPDLRNVLVQGGRSFIPNNSSPQDDEGHGTHVAGIIAMRYDNNGMGGASQARIRAVKALDSDGSGASSWLMDAIMYAADSGCHVISNSWGYAHEYGPDPGISSAVHYAVGKGSLLTFAAGNDSLRTGWPAAMAPESPSVFAVSASDDVDRLAYFSSRGPEIEVMAPGVDIESARLGGGYVRYSGTSMATPYVSAALALMIESGRKSLGYDDTYLPPTEQGLGRVNFLKTVGF